MKRPNCWKRSSCLDTNSFPILHKSMLSVTVLYVFNIDKLLNLLFVMVDLDQVFTLLAVEKDLSGVQDAAF